MFEIIKVVKWSRLVYLLVYFLLTNKNPLITLKHFIDVGSIIMDSMVISQRAVFIRYSIFGDVYWHVVVMIFYPVQHLAKPKRSYLQPA